MKFVDRMKERAAERSELSDAQGERAAQEGVPTKEYGKSRDRTAETKGANSEPEPERPLANDIKPRR